ncbi:hypothetical protein TWF569_003932 [Orbilia oligospora]|uniref:Cystathionine beta-synthase n=2 Tax=Orbilia oligospora TaxID=2813651 RepID=G1X6R7_ARTOA|nr:hypothetical protein AOL_s00054g561 [Orbilia oligospora ATCC 24927]KAF3099945.1 hypothetical protein TWF102_005365 [Orbilia oligospora]EGX51185.1 hypothetical protein AOL_s00054g561 [Orbilia oligospora ATCC 24927]KAF3107721.1 hypothetical protein TWF706_002551 [Orbilia oligospora]KAF3114142.1 hypothetical protein TWF103_001565 [Orbilia oligospora]KAF3136579.1 hypothetical protein TWF594_007843 [Orbilia oligospora]
MSLPSEDAIPSYLRNPPPSSSSHTATPTPAQSLAAKYRGAVIADLDLAPALSVPPQQSISEALAMSYDRSYDQLTVINPQNRSLLGYLSIPRLKHLLQSRTLTEEDTVEEAMTRFRKSKGVKYTVITPETELAELEEFLTSGGGKESGFAVVTDAGRKFVLAVATRDDLENFAKRRG